MLECKECGKQFETLDKLRRHRSQKHNVCSEQSYIDYVLDGKPPECKCGCGEKPKFLGVNAGFRDFKWGHGTRLQETLAFHTPESRAKGAEKQKQMHKTGELVIWNKGLTIDDPRVKDNITKMLACPGRSEKISKAFTGRPITEEAKAKLSELGKIRWADPERREKQRFNRINYFKNKQFNQKSKLEQFFEDLLVDLGIGFENQYPLNGYLYDFYIPSKNILIEVDGDWYHCNPIKHPEAIHPIQKAVVKNDAAKNESAKDAGIELLRFWETDVKKHTESVKEILKNRLL